MKKLNTYSNLNRKVMWKGIVDYKIIIVLLGYFFIVYNTLSFFNISILYIIYFMCLSSIPILGIYASISKEENMSGLLINIIKYILKPKIYICNHKSNNKYKCFSKTIYKKRM